MSSIKKTIGAIAACALAVTLLALTTLGARAADEPAAGRPNIIVLMSDDHSWCDVGFNGNPDVKTPNLDKLASQGKRFNHCYTATAVCAPTRFQFHSGRFPSETQFYDNGPKLAEQMEFETTASVLGKLGYRCVAIGKRHVHPLKNYPFEFLHEEKYERIEGEFASAFIRDFMPKQDRPLYLLVAFTEPHLEWGKADRSVYDPARLIVPPYMPDTPNTREALASYYTKISAMDRKIGEVLDALDASGKANDTLVIWTSEQGMQVPRGKWTACDLGLRTAFVARWPGRIAQGSQTDAFVQYVDMLPTLAEVGGGKTPDGIDGQSFLDVLLGDKKEHRDVVFGASGSFFSVRDHNYKYIWFRNFGKPSGYGFTDVGKHTKEHFFEEQWTAAAQAGDPRARWIADWIKAPPQEEFYDIKNDPYELHNLADKSELAGVKIKLRERLRAWLTEQKDKYLGKFNEEFPPEGATPAKLAN